MIAICSSSFLHYKSLNCFSRLFLSRDDGLDLKETDCGVMINEFLAAELFDKKAIKRSSFRYESIFCELAKWLNSRIEFRVNLINDKTWRIDSVSTLVIQCPTLICILISYQIPLNKPEY